MNTQSIEEWRVRQWPNPNVPRPKKTTIWRWIRNGQIIPPPDRAGREYRLSPHAYVIGNISPDSWGKH